MTRIPEDGVLERATAAIGRPLLEFVLCADLETAAAGSLTAEQFGVLKQLDNTLTGPLLEQFEIAGLHELLRLRLTEPGQDDQPLANKLHLICGGTLFEPTGDSSPEDLLCILARDTFPAFLLPPDDLPIPAWFGPRESHHVMGVLFRHPQAKVFETAILADPAFGNIFGEDDPHSGRSTQIYRSTFRGSGLQLSMLAYTLLVNAWRQTPGREQPPAVEDFCSLTMDQLGFMRSALAGKPLTVRALQAFTGVRLPPGAAWRAGKGVLVRETTERDRQMAPESLKQQVSGTDASGVSTTVNYDGDVLVEFDYPYKVKALRNSVDSGSILEELASPEILERLTTRLRLSLLVAVRREYKVQLVPTWQHFDDPFDTSLSVSWGDPKQAVGLMPTQLSQDDLKAWQEWFGLLDSPPMLTGSPWPCRGWYGLPPNAGSHPTSSSIL